MSHHRARRELSDWTRARSYWDRAAEYLELAATASDPNVQDRFIRIAQHYRVLAEAEERGADKKGAERRSQRGASNATSALTLISKRDGTRSSGVLRYRQGSASLLPPAWQRSPSAPSVASLATLGVLILRSAGRSTSEVP